jgi:hypothetical protein
MEVIWSIRLAQAVEKAVLPQQFHGGMNESLHLSQRREDRKPSGKSK